MKNKIRTTFGENILRVAIATLLLVVMTTSFTGIVQGSSVKFDPIQGGSDVKVSAIGNSWSPGHVISMTWLDGQQKKATVDNNGNFVMALVVPQNAAQGQHQLLFVDSTGNLGYFATATFTVTPPSTQTYTISVSTSPAGLNPKPTGGGTYNSGQTTTVVAQSVTGYTFQKWTENSAQVSTSTSFSFTVTGNRNLVAVYAQNTNPTLTVDRVWTMDGNDKDKASFAPGDPIHFGIVVKNDGSSTAKGVFSLQVTGPKNIVQMGDTPKDFFPGLTTFGISYDPGIIPKDASAGTYTLTETVNYNGKSSSKQSKFTVVPIPPTNNIGTLSITTTPASGGISVDGISKGKGSWSGTVNTGSHTVSFGAVSGFATPSQQKVVVNAGKTTTATGIYTKPSIAGKVFIDTNRDGIQNNGEKGYSGATVILNNKQSTKTDNQGKYAFPNLLYGSAYTVIQNTPIGYIGSTPNSKRIVIVRDTTINFGIGKTTSDEVKEIMLDNTVLLLENKFYGPLSPNNERKLRKAISDKLEQMAGVNAWCVPTELIVQKFFGKAPSNVAKFVCTTGINGIVQFRSKKPK